MLAIAACMVSGICVLLGVAAGVKLTEQNYGLGLLYALAAFILSFVAMRTTYKRGKTVGKRLRFRNTNFFTRE
ncbi:MAG: hypothetical protein G01um101429_809 [Parcubacteria group bacterium Gr01-1014_29]|nr:MAG: hypothetical protein G01um101429_809 [Parcubacteria group bacterium Gr01-1014_29]